MGTGRTGKTEICPGVWAEHFTREELSCPHCHRCVISAKLVDALEELRGMGEEKIRIHDACRCATHNQAVGGVPHSEHVFYVAMQGRPEEPTNGADFDIVGLTLQQMYDRVKRVNAFLFGGIGVYSPEQFVHGDVRTRVARWSRNGGNHKPYGALSDLVVP